MERVLQGWGIDGHNSHTNICSAAARLGYVLWQAADRPSPDHANAKFILLVSAHLESGHYFNPHAQRIIDGKTAGAKLAVIDPRLSNTASMADYWLPAHPGTEPVVLLAMARLVSTPGASTPRSCATGSTGRSWTSTASARGASRSRSSSGRCGSTTRSTRRRRRRRRAAFRAS